jgi:hypothetical protein
MVILVVLIVGGITLLRRTYKGAVIETYEVGGEGIDVRAIAYREEGILVPVPGAFYTYQYRTEHQREWRELLTFRHDDQIPIPHETFHFVNSDFFYFFIGWVFVATPDHGKSWILWDASKDLDGWRSVNYRFIDRIEMASDGTGIMYLNPLNYPHTRLITTTFGRRWDPPSS